MDFVHDALINGRAFRALTVIDQWSRWSPIVEVAHSMSGGAAADALDRAISKHGKPNTITVDHGTEFTSRGCRSRLRLSLGNLDFSFPRGR
jgi:putative transposase